MDGVALIIPVIGSLVILIAVKAGTYPVPDAGSPIDVFEFVQLITAPLGSLKLNCGKEAPSLTTVSLLIASEGVALASNVKQAVVAH